ncbi:MAG: OmpA family protein [Flavobacteriales bacterium]|nr:OmpA family protein [Flavobacteriales bacterium]MCX7650350.1 OmpA family protein [Flavobacteriales bacterium]MDW8431290.1 OmpA family protein [Flavobacteriales bacterium]
MKLWVGAALTLWQASWGQTILERADWFFEDKNYVQAAKEYQQVFDKIKKPELKAEVLYRIGVSYFHQWNFPEAQKWLNQAVEAGCRKGDAFVKLGDMLLMHGDYKAAQAYYQQGITQDSLSALLMAPRLKTCKSAPALTEPPSNLVHQNEKDLNSRYSDFGVAFLGSGKLVYTTTPVPSEDKKDAKDKAQDNLSGLPFSRLFFASGDSAAGVWKPQGPLPEAVNSPFHNGASAFDPANNIFYFTQCNGFDGKGKTCKIYASSYNPASGAFLPPQALPFCSEEYNCAHPAITPDGNILYFSSDKSGGVGGKDLYRAIRSKSGSWSDMMNLGPQINTPGDEVFPTVSGDSLLFFSSDGREGVGNLDIFKVVIRNGVPQKPQLMELPFNSSADDFGLVISPTSKYQGFYCSNRLGGFGMDDIYSFRLNPKFFDVAGYVREEKTALPVANAKVQMKGTDGSVVEVTTDATGRFKTDKCNPQAGYYLLASANGYFSNSTQIPALNMDSREDQSELMKKRTSAEIFLMKITKEEIKLDNIYYEYDSYLLTEESKKELMKLVKLLKETPEVKVQLNSHTDERGSETYNLKLSEKRAESVMNFLMENGIERERMTYKGWGESSPVYKNAKTEEQHAANRRTTFNVIE